MRTRAGMILVELLVGLVVSAAALAAGYAAFVQVAEQRERVERAMDATARSAVIRQTVMEWVRGAYFPRSERGPSFTGIDAVEGPWADDRLTFLTTAPTMGGVGDAVVRLYVDRDEATPVRGLVATISEWKGARFEQMELVPEAVALDIRYLYDFGERHWLPSWVSSSVLPAGVELRIEIPAGRAGHERLLEYPIRVAPGGNR